MSVRADGQPHAASSHPPNDRPNAEATAAVVREDIDTVAQLEREFLQERSFAERLGQLITRFSGTLAFALLNLLLFAIWLLAGMGFIPGIPPFDPFPFSLLTLAVSLEAILLSIFILVSQNSMRRREDERMHLSLQLSLLIEQELTEMLQIQADAFKRLNVLDEKQSAETAPLRKEKHLRRLVEELEQRIPRA